MLKYLFLFAMAAASLQAEVKVLAFAGSTREESSNKKLVAQAAEYAAQTGATVTFIDLRQLPMPLYDGDLERELGMPENAKRLRQLMMDSQVIFISSPEYNHSISGVLKNALDWASRSETGGASREAYEGKKFVLLSASPGKKGGAKGLIHLREIIKDMRGNILPQEFSLSDSNNAFNAHNKLKNPDIGNALKQFVLNAL